MIHAAGILFLAPEKKVLFLKRGPGGDHAGEWCFPGGKLEGDETPLQAAMREATEEVGFLVEGNRDYHTRTVSTDAEPVEFTTFLQRVSGEFKPSKDDEHVGYAWAPVDQPPQPLHPGCQIALDRIGWHELDVARAMVDGRLPSPQRIEGMSLWAIRISGTGMAYRRGISEYVWRGEDIYLSAEMLARCNGLPVIWEHPAEKSLNSKEWGARSIGAIMLPYIKHDEKELWGIARIYDDTAIKLLESEKLSTSPGVVFSDPHVNSKMDLGEGEVLLIEGSPSLIDHICVCEVGVWDKGKPVSGIEQTNLDTLAKKDSVMTDEKEMKGDAETLDKVLKCMDSISKRMDEWEEKEKVKEDKAKKDAEESEMKAKADAEEKEKADKAKKDAEEAEEKEKSDPKGVAADKAKKDEEEKAKMDAAIKDTLAQNAELAKNLAALTEAFTQLKADTAQPTPADRDALLDRQYRADKVYGIHNEKAPAPVLNETVLGYRVRLAAAMQKHSNTWKSIDLAKLDAATMDIAEQVIYADAVEAGKHPKDVAEGELREYYTTDETGRRIVNFAGESKSWLNAFAGNRQRLVGIRNGSN